MRKYNVKTPSDMLSGLVYESRAFGKFKIIEYVLKSSVLIEFLDTGFQTYARAQHIRRGAVKDRLLPTVRGVGFMGDSELPSNTPLYILWNSMLARCYGEDLEKHKAYNGCSVHKNWHNYTTFHSWAINQIGFDSEDWQLDKDILIKGNREYGPELCCFVPREINVLFTKSDATRGQYPIGVYKTTDKETFTAAVCKNGDQLNFRGFKTPEDAFLKYKEEKQLVIASAANKYKDIIDSKVYDALISYEVEITD